MSNLKKLIESNLDAKLITKKVKLMSESKALKEQEMEMSDEEKKKKEEEEAAAAKSENGNPKLDDEGNPVLDDEGNPVMDETEEENDEEDEDLSEEDETPGEDTSMKYELEPHKDAIAAIVEAACSYEESEDSEEKGKEFISMVKESMDNMYNSSMTERKNRRKR